MNTERMAITFAGIPMATPVMGASGTFGFGLEYEDFLDLRHVGAIISKGITPLPRPGNPGVRVAKHRQACSTALAWKIPAWTLLNGTSCLRPVFVVRR